MKVADRPECVGCPLFGDGSQQFVGDFIKPGAAVYLQANQPGEQTPTARVARTYLPLAGLVQEEVSYGHAIRCTAALPKPVLPAQFAAGKRGALENAVRYCDRAHSGIQPTALVDHLPRLVVTQGDFALYAATGQRSSHEWRGWLLPYHQASDRWLSEVWQPGPGDLPVLATVSMSDLRAMPTLTYATRADWRKVGKVLRGEWPKPMPEFTGEPPKVWPRLATFDTEFLPDGSLLRYSLYDGQTLRVVEARDVRTIDIPDTVTVIMHNEDADITHLKGFLKGGRIKTEDSMLAHAALWSDLPHGLAYLGSIYATINRWKHLFHRNPRPYSAGDAFGLWDVWFSGLVPEFQRDTESARVYREELYPLTPIIMEAQSAGLRLDRDRVGIALETHQKLQDEVILEGEAYAGFPLNLGSSEQVGRWLYDIERVGVKQRAKCR